MRIQCHQVPIPARNVTSYGGRRPTVVALLGAVATALLTAASAAPSPASWTVGHRTTVPHAWYVSTVACTTTAHCIGSAEQQKPFRTWNFATTNGRVRREIVRPIRNSYLGAACPDHTHCLLVGSQGDKALVVPWVNSRPQPTVRTKSVNELDGITCLAAGECLAVGNDAGIGAVARLSNTGEVLATYYTAKQAEFSGVACWSAHRCLAVGSKFHGVTIGAVLNDGQPGRQTIVRRHSELDKVACGARGRCIAAGSTYSGKGIIARFRRGTLTGVKIVPQFLYGAACPSPARCFVTGATSPNRGATGIAREVDGGKAAGLLVARGTNGLGDLSCPTRTRCVASSGTGTKAKLVTLRAD